MPETSSTDDIYNEYMSLQAASERIEKRLQRETNLRDRFGFDNAKKIKNLAKKLSHINTTKSELRTAMAA